MQPLTPALAKAAGLPNDQGVLVDAVTDGSPAAHADLRQGDVITTIEPTVQAELENTLKEYDAQWQPAMSGGISITTTAGSTS